MARRKRQQASEPRRNWRENKADLYRRILVRMYGDSKWQALTPLKPSGQALWLYLLTGPHTNLIPGLFSAGRAGLAEQLGWSQDDFDSCWAELESQGLVQAAWQARVVWVPNAIKHNAPTSPSVVTSWRGTWPLIPECSLKWAAYKSIRNHLETEMAPAFASAFVSACFAPFEVSGVQAAPTSATQPAPLPALHQEQEAGTGSGTGSGTGRVTQPPQTAPKLVGGLGQIGAVFEDLRGALIGGDPRDLAEDLLADGVPVEHIVASLRAADWLVENCDLNFGLVFVWRKLARETKVGGTFRFDGHEAPDDLGAESGSVSAPTDPLEGTPYTLARPKAKHRIARSDS